MHYSDVFVLNFSISLILGLHCSCFYLYSTWICGSVNCKLVVEHKVAEENLVKSNQPESVQPTKRKTVVSWMVSAMAEPTREVTQGGPYFHKERIKYSPEDEARLEKEHFWRIIDAFRFYRYHFLHYEPGSVGLCEETMQSSWEEQRFLRHILNIYISQSLNNGGNLWISSQSHLKTVVLWEIFGAQC